MKNGYFDHLTKESDILQMVERFVEENSEPVITKEDEKWSKSEILLLQSLCLFLMAKDNKQERSAYWLQHILSISISEPETSHLDNLFSSNNDGRTNFICAYTKYKAFKCAAHPSEKAIIIQAYEHLAQYTEDIKNGKFIDAFVNKLSNKSTIQCQK